MLVGDLLTAFGLLQNSVLIVTKILTCIVTQIGDNHDNWTYKKK